MNLKIPQMHLKSPNWGLKAPILSKKCLRYAIITAKWALLGPFSLLFWGVAPK